MSCRCPMGIVDIHPNQDGSNRGDRGERRVLLAKKLRPIIGPFLLGCVYHTPFSVCCPEFHSVMSLRPLRALRLSIGANPR